MKLDNKTYDILKWIAQIVLPAAGTLYFALSSIWGLPYGEQIVGTLTAIDAFLGALLGVTTRAYDGDGKLMIDQTDPNKDVYRLDVGDLDKLKGKSYITLKVDPEAKL